MPTREEVIRWASAVNRNAARAPLEKSGNFQGADFAGAISDMYTNLRARSEDEAKAARGRMDQQRAQLLQMFAESDKTNSAAVQNSGNYMSAIAKQLGMEEALASPGAESTRQNVANLHALNQENRTNQLASFDLIRNTYGDLLDRAPFEYDTMAAQDMSALYAQIEAARAAAAAAARGSGGGRGGGGGRGSSSPGYDFSPEPTTMITINPNNPPSGSTYSSDYVRRDFDPLSIGKIRAKGKYTYKAPVGGGGGGVRRAM